ENAIALEPIDVLIISTEEVRAITKTQWGAIEIWVRLGGKLILAAGRHQPFVIESNLNGAFGVEFGHSEPFNLYGDTPTASKVEVLASWPSMHGEGWDRIWLGTEDHPLFAGKQIGRGWFMPCAAALDPPMLQFINSRPDATSWWFSLLESDSGQTPLRTRLNDLEGPLGMSLQAPFAMNLAGAWWVFGYLLSYMLLVVPINWIIFSRLKRKEWAWGTAVLLAVGYSWYGYSTGARSQGKNFQINEASFVSRPDVDAPARGTTFSAIYSPRRFRTDIRSNGPVFPAAMSDFELNWGYRNGEGDLYRNSPLMLSFGDSAMAKGFFLYPWSARNVRSDFLLPAGGSVSVESPLTLDEGGISGQIKNNTAWTFNHWWVLQGSRGWESATPLPQGESQQFANLKPAIVDWASWMTSNVSRRFRPPTERPEQARSYGMQYYLDQQLKYFWDNFRQFNLPSDQALFFGIAEGSASPMTEGMTPDLRVGLIFYEQDLRGKLASTSKDTAASGTIWMPTLLSGQPQWMIGPVSHGKDSKLGPGWQVVPTNIVSLQLTPDPAPEGGIAGELEINFKVIGMPEDTYEKNGIQINGSRYTFAGCPVSIYNFRLQSWETERVWLGQPLRFQGAPDYLQPANHSIALRLNLSAQEMRWKKLNPREEEKNAVTKDLWGGYTPMNFLRFGDCGVNFIEPSSGAAGGTP
ncbi:hypothetical protein HY256_12840, partial [Candidatus Sumerlaeota bacterium]|nr:hypothetical protein [Candidatus Sumerlaeota bacterium]